MAKLVENKSDNQKENNMKLFKIPVKWEMESMFYVKAESLEDAKTKVYDRDVPSGKYKYDSFEIVDDEVVELKGDGDGVFVE